MSEPLSRDTITRVVVNARIRTGDPRRPWADAAALAGDRVVAMGSSAAIRKLAPAGVRVVDAGGVELPPEQLPHYADGSSAGGGSHRG
jgi:predicted amidohydrolase YtcJ